MAMRFLILGATGGTGLELIRRSLACGHSVTAFARSTAGLSEFGSRIDVGKGDLLDQNALASAIPGHDAVLSGFGPRVPVAEADANLLERFATALTGAMEATEVRRPVVTSTAFLFKDSIIPPTYLLGGCSFRAW
jgi:putative NADH-flavin reductase